MFPTATHPACVTRWMRSPSRVSNGARDVRERTRAGQTEKGPSTTGKHTRKRTQKAVVLRRGHFKLLGDTQRPPWPFVVTAQVHEMGMEEYVLLNPREAFSLRGRGNADADDEDELEPFGVAMDAAVSPIGGYGFFVEGEVWSKIHVECAGCGSVCVQLVTTQINAWLDENATEDDTSGDWDVVPFPKTADEWYVRLALYRYNVRCQFTGGHTTSDPFPIPTVTNGSKD
jgi:hypothetical protein